MARYVAFLRGINLGKRRVKMDALRRHFTDLGLQNAQTFIASGNVIFDDAATDPAVLESSIERHLESVLGYDVQTFVRPLSRLESLSRLDRVAAAIDEGFTPHVIFLRSPATETVEASLRDLQTPDDKFHTDGTEVFWFRRGGLSDSSIEARHLERALDKGQNSSRNLDTVRRILEKFQDAPSA